MKLGELMHQLALECRADPSSILEADIAARALNPPGAAEIDLTPQEEDFCRNMFKRYFQDPAFRQSADRAVDKRQASN